MRYCCHHGIVAKTLLVCSLSVAFSAPCFGADYTVHVVEPAVTNHVILSDGPLPPVCKEATEMKLFACRGEYESASFVVSAAEPLESVRIEVGQLSGPGGSWPTDAVDVRVVKEYYRGAVKGRAAIRTLLVHDESFLAIEPDPTPDDPDRMKNVVRGELRDTAELQPVRIEQRKQFWITVHVPEHAKPGTYRTALRILPENDEPSDLTLQIEVYPFDLLSPMLGYSMYYPTVLLLPGEEQRSFHQITARQYRLEMANMLAHGLGNPNICWAFRTREDGSLDFSRISEILRLRESVGMRPKELHLTTHPAPFATRPLTAEERQRTHRYVREIDAWAKERGYDEVFYAANDEQWGEELEGERDSMMAVHEAGGKVFVAVMDTGFFDSVGDLLDRPVLQAITPFYLEPAAKKYTPEESLRHMAEIARGGTFERMCDDELFRKAIDGAHRFGHKIYTYMNPPGGTPLPDLQRRNEGLGLWRVGFDGTMTWAYIHEHTTMIDPLKQGVVFAQVFRTADGVLDTLHWEGYREGVDDVRYLTTLYAALQSAAGRFPHEPLIAETHAWLAEMDVANGDLNGIRREMVRRIIALSDLGYKELTPEQMLAGVDPERVQVIAFPEPWRFRMDPEDQGVTEKWFDPAVDDSGWSSMRTDTKEQGWGTDPGFGWYRTELPLTEQDVGKRSKYLYFGACDEDSWVYVNGRQIFEHSYETTGLVPAEIWLTPFVVPLNDVEVRGRDLLAVRVHNSGGLGGIWKPVRLILSDQGLTKKQIEALIELKTAQD